MNKHCIYVLMAGFFGLYAQDGEVHDTSNAGMHAQLEDVIIQDTKSNYKVEDPSQSLRVTTPLLELPQNVQVITSDLLRSQQTFDIMDGITRNVSGVQRLDQWESYAYINMRGSHVTSFRNGMSAQMPWGPLAEDMSMVDRIEFVKGPAGFMMTTGEPAGFYNVVTKKPTGKQKGEVGFSYGSFDTYRVTTDLDGKLSKNGRLLYRVNLMGSSKGSHRPYEYSNRYSIVPVLKYLINDKTSITAEYTHQFLESNPLGTSYVFSRKGFGDLPRNFTTAEANLAPNKMLDRSFMALFEHQINTNWKLTAQAAYYQYDQTGQSMWPTGFTTVGPDSNNLFQRSIGIWDALGINRNSQLFVNGKFKTGAIEHNVLGGLDLSFKDYFADWSKSGALGDSTFNIYAPKYGTIAADKIPVWDRSLSIRERGVRYTTGANSLYFQDQLGFFNNKLKLTLAGRYTTLRTINPYSGTSSDSKFTPRVGVNYLITKSTAVYALYDQAFLASYGTDFQGKPFKPVVASNIEVGFKKDWFNKKWNSTVSIYQITKENVLTPDLAHEIVAGQYFNKQSGQSRSKGIEFDITGQLIKNLDVVINYAINNNEITKDTHKEEVGKRLPGSSKHLHNTWLTYKLSRGAVSGLSFSLGYQMISGRSNWTVFKENNKMLPDYFRLDGGIGYQKDKFSVNLLVNNLLDQYLYSGGYDDWSKYYYWQSEAGRNFRLNVTYKF